jgi:hypothetical protein
MPNGTNHFERVPLEDLKHLLTEETKKLENLISGETFRRESKLREEMPGRKTKPYSVATLRDPHRNGSAK